MEDRIAALKNRKPKPHPAWRAKVILGTSAVWALTSLTGYMVMTDRFKAAEPKVVVVQVLPGTTVPVTTLPPTTTSTVAPVTNVTTPPVAPATPPVVVTVPKASPKPKATTKVSG